MQFRRFLTRLTALMTLGMVFFQSVPAQAHDDEDLLQLSSVQKSTPLYNQLMYAKDVTVTPAEADAGVVSLNTVLPIFARVNQQYRVFSARDFKYYVENFHYPYRQQFQVTERKPPTQVVLHWTANKRVDIPLYTLSAFLRRGGGGYASERPNQYKNVSNYFLTGTLKDQDGAEDAHMVKLTRGELSSWGDVPRVTAYPTAEAWDDNKYDGRGAIGIEIESPNFRTFYTNEKQRDKLYRFLQLVLQERRVQSEFATLKDSPHWADMQKLYAYLKSHVADIDVDAHGGIKAQQQYVDLILKRLPDINPAVAQEAKRMYAFISGHGVVAREYVQRMIQARRYHDASYDKIDFTEAQVFVVGMELLNYEGSSNYAYDESVMRYIRSQQPTQTAQEPGHHAINLSVEMLPPQNEMDDFGIDTRL